MCNKAHCIPLKYLGFFVTGPFGTLCLAKFNKLFSLQTQGHFFRYSLYFTKRLWNPWNLQTSIYISLNLVYYSTFLIDFHGNWFHFLPQNLSKLWRLNIRIIFHSNGFDLTGWIHQGLLNWKYFFVKALFSVSNYAPININIRIPGEGIISNFISIIKGLIFIF